MDILLDAFGVWNGGSTYHEFYMNGGKIEGRDYNDSGYSPYAGTGILAGTYGKMYLNGGTIIADNQGITEQGGSSSVGPRIYANGTFIYRSNLWNLQ